MAVTVRNCRAMCTRVTGQSRHKTTLPRVTWKTLVAKSTLRMFTYRWTPSYGARSTTDTIHQRRFAVVIYLFNWRPGVDDWSSGMFAGCMPQVQLYVNACSGWPQFALQHHWLLPVNCQFRDCKAQQVAVIYFVISALQESNLYLFCHHRCYIASEGHSVAFPRPLRSAYRHRLEIGWNYWCVLPELMNQLGPSVAPPTSPFN